MPKKVATISGVFAIEGRGTVIALPSEDQWVLGAQERIFRRERIQIRTPGGGCLSTFIADIDSIYRGRKGSNVAFSLPPSITPKDIPDGSELWLERDGTEPVLQPPGLDDEAECAPGV